MTALATPNVGTEIAASPAPTVVPMPSAPHGTSSNENRLSATATGPLTPRARSSPSAMIAPTPKPVTDSRKGPNRKQIVNRSLRGLGVDSEAFNAERKTRGCPASTTR